MSRRKIADKTITYISVFLIIIGLLPILGMGYGILSTLVYVLIVASGIALLLVNK